MKTKMTVVLIAAFSCAILLCANTWAKKPTSQDTINAVATAQPTVGSLEPISVNTETYDSSMKLERSAPQLRPLPACDGCKNNRPGNTEEPLGPAQPVSVRTKRR